MAIKRWREFHRTPHDKVRQVVVDTAKQATKSIHISAYSLTLEDLAAVLISQHRAGLEVAVVADKTQSGGHNQKILLQELVDAGISVTIATSPTGAINHSKSVIIDIALGPNDNMSYSVAGSWNLSNSADKEENFAILDNDPTIASELYQQFLEAQAYGRVHCKQLEPTTPPALPDTAGEKQAATTPTP